jgi:hypothetical protein
MAIAWKSALSVSNPIGVPGKFIVKGRNEVPSYDKKLTDAEVKNVITYMRSLCK